MDEVRISARGVWWCLAAAVFFGASTPLAKRVLENIDAGTLAGLLYVGAALIAAPVAIRQARPAPTRRQWGQLGVAVVVGGGLAPLLMLLALDKVPSPTVSILLNLEVVATAAIAAIVFHERLGTRVVAGIGLIAAAGVVLGWSGGPSARPAALLVVFACVGWGIDNAVTANLVVFTPAQITFAKGAVAGTVNLMIGIGRAGHLPAAGATFAAVAVGAVGYGMSIMLWIGGARLIGAARGQAVYASAPFIGAALAWPIVGQRLTGSAVLAGVIAGAGVVLAVSRSHGHQHRHAPVVHTHVHSHNDGHHDYHHHDDDAVGDHEHWHEHQLVEHTHTHATIVLRRRHDHH
ncbi:MAG: DMT family transporter [Ilumatobacteraceae bacterium]